MLLSMSFICEIGGWLREELGSFYCRKVSKGKNKRLGLFSNIFPNTVIEMTITFANTSVIAYGGP
jgi:hypothetical protein